MNTIKTDMAQQIAAVASAFQLERTGHAPKSVTVVMDQNTLVITLHEALSPAEKVMAQNAAGAAQIQEYHRQLFASSSTALRQEIKRITGVEIREGAAEIESATGTVIHAFPTGNVVQVFQLAKSSTVDTSVAPDGAASAKLVNHDPGHNNGSTQRSKRRLVSALPIPPK